MRLLFVLTIATAFALPISAQAGSKGGGGSSGSGGGSKAPASNAASQQTPKGTSVTVRKAGEDFPAVSVKKPTVGGGGSTSSSGSGSSKVNPTPKPAAEADKLINVEGVAGESQDDPGPGHLGLPATPISPPPPPPTKQ
jgi:hypothetical protein